MPMRTYSDLNPSDLESYASSRGGGYQAAHQLKTLIQERLTDTLITTLTEDDVHAIGIEFEATTPSGSAPFSNLDGTIGLSVIWFIQGSSADSISPVIRAFAIEGDNDPEAIDPLITTGGDGNETNGSFFVCHYSGNESDINASLWENAATPGSTILTSNFTLVLLDTGVVVPFFTTVETWHGFGTRLKVTSSRLGALNVQYSDCEYRNLEWLLTRLGFLDKLQPAPITHPFTVSDGKRKPDWATEETISGTFSVGGAISQPYPAFVSTVGDDAFLNSAVDFFEHWQSYSHVDGVERVGSLEDVVERLSNRADRTSGGITGFTLVTHASETLHIPLTSSGSPPSNPGEGRRQLDAPADLKADGATYINTFLNDSSYEQSTFAKNLRTVRDAVDTNTIINIRGCRIGNDTAYLEKIAKFFGRGKPTIVAPKQWYYYGTLGPVAEMPDNPQLPYDRDNLFNQLFGAFNRSLIAGAYNHWSSALPDVRGNASFSEDSLWEYLETYPLPLAQPGEETSLALVVRTVDVQTPFAKWLDEFGGPMNPISGDGSTGPNSTPVDWMQMPFHDDPNTDAERIYRADPRWNSEIAIL